MFAPSQCDGSSDRGNPARSRSPLTRQAGAINIYDRRNIFYVDIFTLERQNQLGFVPTLGIKVAVD